MTALRNNANSHSAIFRLLATFLTAGAVILPVAKDLHLIFASHAHRYCLEHRQYEDVLRVGFSRQRPSAPNSGAVYADLQAHATNHVRCLLANHVTPIFRVVSGVAFPSGWIISYDTPATRHVSNRGSVTILAQAPKQSPPVSSDQIRDQTLRPSVHSADVISAVGPFA